MAITWTEEKAAHLYRRAAWGATAEDITESLSLGLGGTVSKLLNYEGVSTTALDQRIASLGLNLTTVSGIQRWWLIRLIYSPRPLEERMTFFWHDHFATAISKVADATLMFNQNQLFRSFALGDFHDLTVAVSKDPAMLIWLDNFTSIKGRPNENYGRELLELFTLGQGHYGEEDVLAATNAFTGWGLRRGVVPPVFEYRDLQHDHSVKNFLGQRGDWNGEDIVRILTEEYENARFIAAKLFSYFAYDYPEQSVIDRFADIYTGAGTNIRPVVEAILLSDEMYSEQAIGTKIKSPVDHTVMGTRQLLIDSDGRLAAGTTNTQGEGLFNPPDVAGWDGGLTWINSGTLLSRMNYANSIAFGFDPARFTAGAAITKTSELVAFYLRRLGPLTIDAATRTQLERYVSPSEVLPTGTQSTIKMRGLAHMILSLPEWQTK